MYHTFTRSPIHLAPLRFIPINRLSSERERESEGTFSSNERKRLAVSHFTLVCSIESIIFTCYVKKAIDTICALLQYIRINSNLNQAHHSHTKPRHTTHPTHRYVCATWCSHLFVCACLSFELFLINNWSEFPIYFLEFFFFLLFIPFYFAHCWYACLSCCVFRS